MHQVSQGILRFVWRIKSFKGKRRACDRFTVVRSENVLTSLVFSSKANAFSKFSLEERGMHRAGFNADLKPHSFADLLRVIISTPLQLSRHR